MHRPFRIYDFKQLHIVCRSLLRLIVLFIILISVSAVDIAAQDLIQRTLNGSLNQTELKSDQSSHSPFKVSKEFKSSAYNEYTDEAIYLSVDIDKIGRILKNDQSNYVIEIPVSADKSFRLFLEEVEVLTPGYYTETSSGQIIYPDYNRMKFLRGRIENDSSSTVSISIIDNQLRGVLSDKDGNYNLGLLPSHKSIYTLYNDRSLKLERDYTCKTDEVLQYSRRDEEVVEDKVNKSNVTPCVPIYVEADYETYLDNGSSISQVETYVMSLIAEVAMIYDINTGDQEDPKSISISLAKTFVWDQVDPYRSINNSGEILDLFGGRIYNNQSDPGEGKLSHFISTRNLYSGVAWVDVLCSDFSEYCLYSCSNGNSGYAPCGLNINGCTQVSPTQLTYPGPAAVSTGLWSISSFPNYSWAVEVFAHEMGHNMGSPHTHACAWNGNNTPIDGCGPAAGYSEGCSSTLPDQGEGTIMSYCHLVNGVGISLSNGFGIQPGELIYNNYIAGDCSLACTSNDIAGCTDQVSHNYNPEATIDDDSCETCSDGILNGDEIGVDCGGTLCSPCQGCTDSNAHNYDPIATVDNGSCETCDDGILNGDEIGVDCGGTVCSPCQGCTDANAHNYDPIASVNDGSCETCDDGELNGDEIGVDCGGTLCSPCQGCTDSNAHNYDPIATVYDGSCETCNDGILNGDEVGVDCGGTLCSPCQGCTDSNAHNYDPIATVYDGSCETCNDGILNGDEVGVDCGGTLCSPCQGCTDSNAHNYDPIATVNDGSCETCDDNTLNGDEEYIDCGGSLCAPCITGCDTDADAYNYAINADIAEACETCFDGILNGDEQAIDCGGSYPGCPACITGCKEVFADNYNPNADIAGACIYDCDALSTSMVDNTNKNKIIISNSNNLSTEMLQNIEVDTSMPVYWRAQQTIELNQGFSVKSGTEITIDSGPCAND